MIIARHGAKPGFRAVIVTPDGEGTTVELLRCIPRGPGQGFTCIWAEWQPRTDHSRLWPAWVTSVAPLPAIPFEVWVERQIEIEDLAGAASDETPWHQMKQFETQWGNLKRVETGPSVGGWAEGNLEPRSVTPRNKNNSRIILKNRAAKYAP